MLRIESVSVHHMVYTFSNIVWFSNCLTIPKGKETTSERWGLASRIEFGARNES